MLSQGRKMEVIEIFDLTKSISATAQLCGVDRKTVRKLIAVRSSGISSSYRERVKVSDPFEDKIMEWIEKSSGKVRADVIHEKLTAMGYTGSERTTRRVVNEFKKHFRQKEHRVYKPWVVEPGLWMQYDFAKGPKIGGAATILFCAWMAWSRYRVVFPIPDRSLPSVIAALDKTFRLMGGIATYVLTDNERTVSIDHIAKIAVRNPQMTSAAIYYGFTLATCVPYDPESKGGSESTVRVAKADLIPGDVNLIEEYNSHKELEEACEAWMETVNNRAHSVTRETPQAMLELERTMLHPVPDLGYSALFGLSRSVSWSSTIAYKGATYSVPHNLAGSRVWVRTQGNEVVIVSMDHKNARASTIVATHQMVHPGGRSICDEHYPPRPSYPDERPPRAQSALEKSFLALGHGASRWLVEAASAGTGKMRLKMANAIELAHFYGNDKIDEALGLCALTHRFSQDDLLSMLERPNTSDVIFPSGQMSLQEGTGAWEDFGR